MERKRNIWSEEETIYFLHLLKEKKILTILDGKRFKAAEVYKALESEMRKKGYNRNSVMMKTKWKNLKAEYYKTKKHNNKSGVEGRYCSHYELLDELLGDRPSVAMEGIDSSLTSESGELDESQMEDLENSNFEESEDCDIPELYEVSEDGHLSNILTALPEGVPSSSKATPAKVTSCRRSDSLSSSSRSNATPTTRNSTAAALLDVKESIKDSLSEIKKSQVRDDEFLERLLKGQAELLREMTKEFIEGIGQIFKKKKRRHRSSSSDSESEDERRKKKK